MMVGPFYRARGKPLADGHDHLVERIALGSHRHCTSVGGPGRQGQGAVKVCWPPWSQLALRRWTNGLPASKKGMLFYETLGEDERAGACDKTADPTGAWGHA